MLRIWGRTNSINVQKVMWTVGELALAHERIDAGGAFGGLDTDAFGALNPNRRIPCLVDGDLAVWESNAIVRYLAARYGSGRLWPEAPGPRSLADRWMDWKITTLMPQLHVMFWGLVRTPEAERDMAAIEAAAEAIVPLWQLVDRHLASTPFLAGHSLTMGDIPLAAAFWRYRNLAPELPSLPHVERWYGVIAERPAYREHVMLPVT
jgi:glutathione S-transferase